MIRISGPPPWTETAVKCELPDVPVKLPSGAVVTATVRGRLLPYASPHLPDGGTVEVAWSTLVTVLNSHGAVRA